MFRAKKLMKKIDDFKIQIEYLIIGISFGMLFPIFAWGYEFYSNNYKVSKINIHNIIQRNPLILMITTAPFFLGLFAFFGGIQRAKAEKINKLLTVEIEERKKVQEKIEYLAYHDQITGLPNRGKFYEQVEHAISLSSRLNKKFAVLFLDLDEFKKINDTIGHSLGDLILTKVASRLLNTLRESDTVSRIGGDEFNILIESIENIEDISIITDKVLKSIEKPFIIDHEEYFITASIGIAVYPVDGDTVEALIKNADMAMYKAKNNGKNQFMLYSSKSVNKMKIYRRNLSPK